MTKNSVIIICCTWDDPKGVKRLLDNTECVDAILIGDGKFIQWYGVNEYNPDFTHDLVKSYPAKQKIFYTQVEGKTESQKRSFLMRKASSMGYKWGLIIDSDEIPKINCAEFREELIHLDKGCFGSYAIMVDNYGIPQRKPRLINLYENPYYEDNHSKMYSGIDCRDINQDITICLYTMESIYIQHDKEFYSKKRFENRHKFGITEH